MRRTGYARLIHDRDAGRAGMPVPRPAMEECLDPPANPCWQCETYDGLTAPELIGNLRERFTAGPRRLLRRNDAVYRQEETCRSLFMVDSGCIKASAVTPGGREHVWGFYLPGDLIGLDGVAGARYLCSMVALDQASTRVLPLSQLRYRNIDEMRALISGLLLALSSELNRDRETRIVRNRLDAELRVCSFLLEWSQRLRRIGLSSTDLRLPMSRSDIGSYLGMSQETVSRMFAALSLRGMIQTRGKTVRLVAPERMKEWVERALSD